MRRFLIAAAAVSLLAATARTAEGPIALKTLELGRGPTVVLVHELGGNRLTWMPFTKKLMATNRVVAVDLPGHGESPMPDPFSLDAAAQALDRVLAQQKAESTVVVGHGLGGLVALAALGAHPERARGLVMIGAAAKLQIPDQQKKQFLDYLDQNYDNFVKLMFTQLGRDSAQGASLHAQAAQVPSAVMKAYFRVVLDADASLAAKKLKMPVLFVSGDKQWPATKDWATVAKETGLDQVATATGRRIASAGHYVMLDQADTLATTLREFETKAIAAKK